MPSTTTIPSNAASRVAHRALASPGETETRWRRVCSFQCKICFDLFMFLFFHVSFTSLSRKFKKGLSSLGDLSLDLLYGASVLAMGMIINFVV